MRSNIDFIDDLESMLAGTSFNSRQFRKGRIVRDE